jgi:hypothetical protein
MSKPIIKIVNVETGEEIEREMTEAEFIQFEADQIADSERKKQLAAKATAKAELLNRLGITEEEARLLLG